MKIEIDHVYRMYNLYQLLYSPDTDYKAFEAVNAVRAAEYFSALHQYPDLNVVELFAGRSEHRHLFLHRNRLTVNSYIGVDIEPSNAGTHVITGNALLDVYPEKCNFVVAHHNSLGGCLQHRKQLDRLFENVYRNLSGGLVPAQARGTKSGAFYFQLCANGYQEALLASNVSDYPSWVPIHHPLRNELGIDPLNECVLEVKGTSSYDRVACTVADHIKTVDVCVRGRLTHTISIKNPLLFRYWSETEVVDSAKAAGFRGFVFYRNTAAKREMLTNVVHEPDIPYASGSESDGTAVANFMTTDMMVMI